MSRDISPPIAKRRKTSSRIPVVHESVPPAVATSSKDPPTIGSNTMRIYSWNVNGITPFLQKSIKSFFQDSSSKPSSSANSKSIPAPSLRGFLMRHNWPAMLFLQEVKIATKDTKTQNSVRAAINETIPSEKATSERGPMYEAYFTLPNDPFNARGMRGNGKVYGVCTILRSDLHRKYSVHVRTVSWDKEGRISVVELQSSSSKLAVFNIYAVNGTDNPYRDPKNGSIRGTRHDRKLEIHRLLMQECLDLQKEGWHILLAGDMNVAPDHRDGHPKLREFPHQHVLNRKDFHEKLLESKDGKKLGLNGVDIWRKMHDDERRYTYFSRGREWGSSCDRVDYFIAGRKTWDDGLVQSCGILDSEEERGPSDHVPIWADIRFE